MINAGALGKPDFEKFHVRVLGHILTTIRNTGINSWQFFFVLTGDGKPSLPRKNLFYEYESHDHCAQPFCCDSESVGTSIIKWSRILLKI